MSKVLKIQTIPKSINVMGSVENEDVTMLGELLKIDAFKDWLEPVSEDQYKARCSVCNVMLDCDKNELTNHASGSGHQSAVQNIRKRKSVLGQLIGKVNMTNASGSSGGPPRKIILLRRNLPPNVKCEVVREPLTEETEGDISLKVISPSSLEKTLQINELQLAQQRKRKSFRLEWLDIPEFKDWLSPDPDSPYKARCLACNTILNAGKSELEKHAAGAKHEKAVEALKRMVLEQQAWDEANDIEDEDDVEDIFESGVSTGTQTILVGEEVSLHALQEQNQQMELLNRIATSVESLASSAANAVENLNKNQETLNNILMQLTNK